MLKLREEEPSFAPWQAVATKTFARDIATKLSTNEVSIIAVDGRSASGKTTLADKLASALPDAVVVHTDDIAWHHSMFDWMELALEHVLKPARASQEISYRPTAWLERNREGAIKVPKTCRFLILEGVGSASHALISVLDYVIWVQSDFEQAQIRGIERDGGDEQAASFWHKWMAEEVPFLLEQRPWERADAIVCGTRPNDFTPPSSSYIVMGQVH